MKVSHYLLLGSLVFVGTGNYSYAGGGVDCTKASSSICGTCSNKGIATGDTTRVACVNGDPGNTWTLLPDGVAACTTLNSNIQAANSANGRTCPSGAGTDQYASAAYQQLVCPEALNDLDQYQRLGCGALKNGYWTGTMPLSKEEVAAKAAQAKQATERVASTSSMTTGGCENDSQCTVSKAYIDQGQDKFIKQVCIQKTCQYSTADITAYTKAADAADLAKKQKTTSTTTGDGKNSIIVINGNAKTTTEEEDGNSNGEPHASVIRNASLLTPTAKTVELQKTITDNNKAVQDAQTNLQNKASVVDAYQASAKTSANANVSQADKLLLKQAEDSHREAKQTLKQAEKSAARAETEMAKNDAHNIVEENRSGQYGGKYGGADVGVTQAMNNGVQQVSGVLNQVGQMSVNTAGASATNNVMMKGSAATQLDYAQAQSAALTAAAKAQTTAGVVTSGLAAMQTARAVQHSNSVGTVNDTSVAASTALRNSFSDDSVDPDRYDCTSPSSVSARTKGASGGTQETCQAWKKQQYDYYNNNRLNNENAEVQAQKAMGITQSFAAMTSAANAAKSLMQAAQNKKLAAILPTSTGGGFSFNPGNPNGYMEDGVTAAPSVAAGAIVDGTLADDPMKNTDQFNPGGDSGVADGKKDAFAAGGPAGGAPGGGGGGLSTGGTSAAKDDGAGKDNAPPGKTSAGSYSAGDNTSAGSYSRNAGSGAGIGMDNSFADLLKKFLPGGEDEKKGDMNMAFDQDRSPSSDAAAVIGRNKNIFEEVHKRYEKKSNEGAIVF